ncbi:hypothetical protein [Alkalihalobacterium bogoriense]|nr:hypothetical protein [Alkalihalobacterium bogoriense]
MSNKEKYMNDSNEKNKQTPEKTTTNTDAQSDGFRYDYDDSSDLKN